VKPENSGSQELKMPKSTKHKFRNLRNQELRKSKIKMSRSLHIQKIGNPGNQKCRCIFGDYSPTLGEGGWQLMVPFLLPP
jgi:hypothetical protein